MAVRYYIYYIRCVYRMHFILHHCYKCRIVIIVFFIWRLLNESVHDKTVVKKIETVVRNLNFILIIN